MPIIKTSYFPVCSFPDSALRTVMMQADGLQRNISSIRPLSPLKCLAILPFSPGDSQKWLTPWLLTQNSNHQNLLLSYLLFFFCSFRDIYLRAGFMFMFWVQSFRFFFFPLVPEISQSLCRSSESRPPILVQEVTAQADEAFVDPVWSGAIAVKYKTHRKWRKVLRHGGDGHG